MASKSKMSFADLVPATPSMDKASPAAGAGAGAGPGGLDAPLSTASLESVASLKPTPKTSKELSETRRAALRKFRTGYIVDAETNHDARLVPVVRQGLRGMYTATKSMGREKLRMDPKLLPPMRRLWTAALDCNRATAGAQHAEEMDKKEAEEAQRVKDGTDPAKPRRPSTSETRSRAKASWKRAVKAVKRTHEHVMWDPPPPPKASQGLSKEDYVLFFARVFRCMHHPLNAQIDERRYQALPGKKLRKTSAPRRGPSSLTAEMRELLEKDWENDSKGETTMFYGAFHDAMFEVADIWTSYDTIYDYVHFLHMLWVALTYDGIHVRTLPDVRAYNEVAYEKSNGNIRGPATFTMTIAPVSLYGNSNWGSVAFPSTFFPPQDPPPETDDAEEKDSRPKRIFSAGLNRRRYIDENGMPVYCHGAAGVQLVINPSMRLHMEDAFIMDAPGPRSAYYIPHLHRDFLKEDDALLKHAGWVMEFMKSNRRPPGAAAEKTPVKPSRSGASPMLSISSMKIGEETSVGSTVNPIDRDGRPLPDAALVGYLDSTGQLVLNPADSFDPSTSTPLVIATSLIRVDGRPCSPAKPLGGTTGRPHGRTDTAADSIAATTVKATVGGGFTSPVAVRTMPRSSSLSRLPTRKAGRTGKQGQQSLEIVGQMSPIMATIRTRDASPDPAAHRSQFHTALFHRLAGVPMATRSQEVPDPKSITAVGVPLRKPERRRRRKKPPVADEVTEDDPASSDLGAIEPFPPSARSSVASADVGDASVVVLPDAPPAPPKLLVPGNTKAPPPFSRARSMSYLSAGQSSALLDSGLGSGASCRSTFWDSDDNGSTSVAPKSASHLAAARRSSRSTGATNDSSGAPWSPVSGTVPARAGAMVVAHSPSSSSLRRGLGSPPALPVARQSVGRSGSRKGMLSSDAPSPSPAMVRSHLQEVWASAFSGVSSSPSGRSASGRRSSGGPLKSSAAAIVGVDPQSQGGAPPHSPYGTHALHGPSPLSNRRTPHAASISGVNTTQSRSRFFFPE